MTILKKSFFYLFLSQLASIIFSIAIAQMLYAVLFVVWLILIFKERQFSFTLVDLIFVAFIAVRILSIVISEYPEASTLSYLREIIFYPYYFIAKYFVQSYGVSGVKQSVSVLIYSLIIPSVYAIVYVALGLIDRGRSFSSGSMMFSVHSAFVIAGTLALILTEEHHKRKNILLLILGLFIAALLSTYTRSMWIAVAICLVIFGYAGYKKYLLATTVAVILMIASIAPLRERFSTLLSPMEHSSGRVEIWNAAIELMPKHPIFGFGPETFNLIAGDKSRFPDHRVNSWHNEFMQIQIESGIIATILLLLIYFVVAWMILQLRKGVNTEEGKFMFYFSLFSFVVIVSSIMFGSLMFSILNGMMLKFIIASISSYSQRNNIVKQFQWRRA